MPLALVTVFSLFGFGLFTLPEVVESFVGWPVIGGLFGLAALEGILDKAKAAERGLNVVLIPVRAASGGIFFYVATWAVLSVEAISWLLAGTLIAGIVSCIIATLKSKLRPPAKVEASGVSSRFLSAVEDLVALAGVAVGALIPLVPLFLVGFLLFFYFRIRRRRGRKYGGLRILGD